MLLQTTTGTSQVLGTSCVLVNNALFGYLAPFAAAGATTVVTAMGSNTAGLASVVCFIGLAESCTGTAT